MVMFLSQMELWLIVGIAVLLLLAFLTAGFICFRRMAKKKQIQLYTIEEISRPSRNSLIEILEIYRNFNKIEKGDQLLNCDNESNKSDHLVDSTDLTDKFTKSVLRLNSEYEDVNPRVSTGSLRTFYSVNMSRTNSRCSFASCSEGSDSGEYI
ncbi:uncharacterized protein [Euwallacea similis]|uniref:uncharacterized protein n=1 Tax=Euwallacea similis TaxID=1736056 RepID=UPI00345031E2